MESFKLSSLGQVPQPVDAYDIANKKYVDSKVVASSKNMIIKPGIESVGTNYKYHSIFSEDYSSAYYNICYVAPFDFKIKKLSMQVQIASGTAAVVRSILFIGEIPTGLELENPPGHIGNFDVVTDYNVSEGDELSYKIQKLSGTTIKILHMILIWEES